MDREDVYPVCFPHLVVRSSAWLLKPKESLIPFYSGSAINILSEEPHCIAARGGIYNPQESSDWSPLGTWQLGLSYLGYDGNGNYGRDVINTQSPLSDDPFTMDGVLIATINTTNYLNGLFGLGITQSNFNGTVADSPLTQAVGTYGLIPSYSFGYTAGAYYSMPPSIQPLLSKSLT